MLAAKSNKKLIEAREGCDDPLESNRMTVTNNNKQINFRMLCLIPKLFFIGLNPNNYW